MADFMVVSCTYNGSAGGFGESNPLCWVEGGVNGNPVHPSVFLACLKAASAAGKMQEALTALMFNWYAQVYRASLTPWPELIPMPAFPPVEFTTTRGQGTYRGGASGADGRVLGLSPRSAFIGTDPTKKP